MLPTNKYTVLSRPSIPFKTIAKFIFVGHGSSHGFAIYRYNVLTIIGLNKEDFSMGRQARQVRSILFVAISIGPNKAGSQIIKYNTPFP